MMSGKGTYEKNLKKNFPGEEKAIDKFVAILKVCIAYVYIYSVNNKTNKIVYIINSDRPI